MRAFLKTFLTLTAILSTPALCWGQFAQSYSEVLMSRVPGYLYGETTGEYEGLPIVAGRAEELVDKSEEEQIAVYRRRANMVCQTWNYQGAADYSVRPVTSVNDLPVFENGEITVETIRPVIVKDALSVVTTYLLATPIWQNPRVFSGITCYKPR